MGRQSPRRAAVLQAARNEARRARLRFNQLSLTYESFMRELHFSSCIVCNKRKRADVINQAGRCTTCARRNAVHLFTAENGMDIGAIPEELLGLTMIEQILIARVHPVVSVFKIRGQQTGYSGHVLNFAQHVEDIATRLPHDPRYLTTVLLLRRDTVSGVAEFRVRSQVVGRALRWLQINNRYYSDIIVDNEALNRLPRDGDIGPNLPAIDDEPDDGFDAGDVANNIIEGSGLPNLPNPDAGQQILHNLSNQSHITIDGGRWPHLDRQPLNEFTSEGYICMAFPALFPTGQGDLNAPRLRRINKHQYFKFLLQYRDGRFANDKRFPYFAYNTLARHDAINCGAVYVRRNGMQNLTVGDLIAIARRPDHDLAASIMYYGVNLRGTRAYWKQRSAELTQMVHQLGAPTVFFTLTAADYHWPDLFRILRPGIDPQDINERTRKLLMHENPATVAWFFEQRVAQFMNSFLIPFFDVGDYWYRYEWQHRGSPHVHGLLWLNEAPDCSDLSSVDNAILERITTYFTTLTQAWRPGVIEPFDPQNNPCRIRLMDVPDGEAQQDLNRILCAIQRHSRCGTHCMRKKRGTRGQQLECRYGFPVPLEPSNSLRIEEGAWKFFPRRNDDKLARYNKFITLLWRGNSDFSPITSLEAVVKYIAKYASKGEYSSGPFTNIVNQLLLRTDPESDALRLVRQALISTVAERNYSAQEIIHLVMGWPLYHSSREMVVVALRDDWVPVRGDARSFMQRYAGRAAEYHHLCLFDFAKRFYFRGERMVERRKDAIVRTTSTLKASEDHEPDGEFYQYSCKLFINWHGNFESIKPEGQSWQELYNEHVMGIENNANNLDELLEQHEPDQVQDEQDPEEDGARIVRDAGMALARINPAINVEEDVLGQRVIDEAFDWATLSSSGLATVQASAAQVLQDFLRNYKQAPLEARQLEPVIDFANMTVAQRAVINLCRQQIEGRGNFSIKRCIVQGKAGTGKSATIKAMCRILSENQIGYQVLAPTGQAAANIDGSTLHSFLKIPVQGEMLPLRGENLNNFQRKMRNIPFIIIDEYSMIGKRLLRKIHMRLCEGYRSTNEPFGGCIIYLFGDIRQLPPVKDTPIYMASTDDFSALSTELVRSFQRKIVLQVCHRQGNDEEFLEVLDELAIGEVSQDGWRYLQERRMQVAHFNPDDFSHAIHLFPTNAEVSQHNRQHLEESRSPVALIEAEHNSTIAKQGSDALAEGLSARLFVSIGARVMLRKNLCVERGLVNGALGFVRQIIYEDGQRPPSLPCVLLIEFDRYPGPFIGERTFPLRPVRTTWSDRGVECSRRQFPINLAYALTIHKSQGLTLDKAVVEIGRRETTPGLSYVGLSRVRRSDDLLLRTYFDYDRVSSIGRMRQVISREHFIRETFDAQ